jgi:hypothetical protein
MSREILKYYRIKKFLVKELQSKKLVPNGRRYTSSSEQIKIIYNEILFDGQLSITPLDTFPCHFRGYFSEILGTESAERIYYDQRGMTENLFEESEWRLENGDYLTEVDTGVFKKYQSEWNSFLDRCSKFVEGHSVAEEAQNTFENERKKLGDSFNKVFNETASNIQ